MSYPTSRNIQDADLIKTRALTAADGSVTSADLDLGTDAFKPEDVELVIEIPALLAAELNTADTLVVAVQHGAAAAPTTALGLTKTITGTGSAIDAQTIRFRLPPDTLRYLNVKFTTSGTTGDMSDKTATISLRF